MNTKIVGSIIVVLLILIGAVGYVIYSNPNLINNSSSATIGSSKVSIPEGYQIQKKEENGVLFSNSKTNIGIYEVPKGGSFNKKVEELEKKYGNDSISNNTYKINDTTLKSVTVQNEKNKFKETYFEKNGVKYHIYEKGAEDKAAFNTLFNSISK